MHNKPPIRVLLVDDSQISRDFLREILHATDDISVVGEAHNGQQAVAMVEQLKPDVVCMDLEMPVMSGAEAIDQIMHRKAVPILVVSGEDDAQKAYEALSLGALEVIKKPRFTQHDTTEFAHKVRLLAGVPVITRMRRKTYMPELYEAPQDTDAAPQSFKQVVAIACSTGGPQALSYLLANLDTNLQAPVLISQHMSDGFVDGMVQWLSGFSSLPIKVAVHGERIEAKQVYLSPSEQHMTVDASHRIKLLPRQEQDIYRPCCNYLFDSVAQHFGRHAIALIMTGMGRDGASGMQEIKQSGGITLAQDEASSVIFGMNFEAISLGCIDEIIALDKIPHKLNQLVSGAR